MRIWKLSLNFGTNHYVILNEVKNLEFPRVLGPDEILRYAQDDRLVVSGSLLVESVRDGFGRGALLPFPNIAKRPLPSPDASPD